MGLGTETERQAGRPAGATTPPAEPKRRPWREALPDLWALVAPRRRLLGLGLALMVVNRASGLVLPASTRFLIDDVIGRRRADLLGPLVGAVLAATALQGLTSFAL